MLYYLVSKYTGRTYGTQNMWTITEPLPGQCWIYKNSLQKIKQAVVVVSLLDNGMVNVNSGKEVFTIHYHYLVKV